MLCSNKVLFTKTDGGLELAPWLQAVTRGLEHEYFYREAGLEGEQNFLEGQTLSRGIPSLVDGA